LLLESPHGVITESIYSKTIARSKIMLCFLLREKHDGLNVAVLPGVFPAQNPAAQPSKKLEGFAAE
jgi:hypothetical protein